MATEVETALRRARVVLERTEDARDEDVVVHDAGRRAARPAIVADLGEVLAALVTVAHELREGSGSPRAGELADLEEHLRAAAETARRLTGSSAG